jgi:hypothetical protein
MASQADYTSAANAILAVLRGIVAQYAKQYPDMFHWEEQVAQRLLPIAGQCAKASVDAVDAERAAASQPQPMNPAQKGD